jgi:lipid II isoglutaminyl synthase (glutamine-hydrolysing)
MSISETPADSSSPAGNLHAGPPSAPPDRPSPTAGGAPPPSRPGWARGARAACAVVAGRAAGALARRLRLGAGTSIPGLVARRVDPDVTTYLAGQLRHGSVVITGTNGKTTTSGMIAAVLRGGGLRVWRNREGANLARGVTAALLIRSRPHGRLRWGGEAAAVFEVDEAAFPQVVREVQPRAVVVTNLFRDQLDRYGEVDTVTERWRAALAALPAETALVLNADDPAVAALGLDAPAGRPVLYFGVASADQRAADGGVEVVDSRTCARCGAALTFDVRFYSHVGHWRCPRCGLARPQPAVEARDVSVHGLEGSAFLLVTPQGQLDTRIGLPGLYNVYNALAAATVGHAMRIDVGAAVAALGRFTPAFGRAERVAAGDKTVWLLLAKNPTGLNEVLRALGASGGQQRLLAILNDRAADGEDVSWIWDADFERMADLAAHVTVAGLRAYDLALRLKYAEVKAVDVVPDIAEALRHALDATPAGGTLCIVPTYTALLAVRAELERRGYAKHYWEQRDV